ncbi:hypothetical protein EV182_001266 [Spiromyces aspiralis]|uniref:Uncharacterized protein n=1 Tax=Spiromyces aspiralis TaxID=68401 RepID=A0ACC1HFQ6_9FUNG|nr:hypothetical protein EV182_001266 [Spiromyces aspiralis]
MAARGSGDTMMTKVVVTANTSPKANRLQRRLKLLPRRRENKESPQKSSDQHQQLVKNSSTAKSARGQDLAALDTPPGRRERSSSMPQPAQAVRVPERMPLNPSRPNLTLEIRLNNAKEAFSQLQASSPTSRTATPTRHITNNSPSTPTSLFPSPQVPPRSAIVPSLPTTGMAVASSSSRSQQSDGGPSSSPSRRADGGYWHESSLAEDGWEIVEPGWRAAVASPSARPSTPHKPPLPGYFAQKQRLPPTQLKPSPSAASLSIAHGSSIDPTWLANNHHHQPSSSPSMATPHSNATGGMPSLLQAKHSAMELSSAADGARGDASATAADEARKKFSARPIPLTTQVAKDRPEGPRPLGVPVTQSRPTSLPNGFTMDIGRNPFFHSTSDIGMFTAHPNYSTDSDLSVPTLATRVRTMTSRNAAIGGSDGLVRRSPSNASSERSARYAHYRAPSSSSATASASASTYAKPPLYLPAKKAAKRITRECSVM